MSASKKKANFSRPNSLRSVSITGTGSYLPEKVLSNADLEKIVETTDDWITSRTGIRERRLAATNQFTSDLGADAVRRALADAKVPPSKVDMIICPTITPDMPFPSTACLIQHKVGATHAACFDIEAACSGFVYGLEIGRNFVTSGTYNTVVVVAAEKLSSIIDWKDRNTCVLFGDGAGAAVLQHDEGSSSNGILYSSIRSNGTYGDLLCMPGGGARNPASTQTLHDRMHYLKMMGKEVYKHAVREMSQAATDALARCQLKIEDITCIIPHQANMRIIEATADRLGVSSSKFYLNLHRYGNMSAASAAVALDEAAHEGRFKRGDYILVIAFGAGLTWGATVIEW
jgi:3-oxoacyl-[acyl-carrier-protein] synthase III